MTLSFNRVADNISIIRAQHVNELQQAVEDHDVSITRVDPGANGQDNQFLVWDSSVGHVGWFQGPVLLSNGPQDKIPTDGTTPCAAKLNAFFARAAALKMRAVLLPGYTYVADQAVVGVSNLWLYGYGATLKLTEPAINTACLSFSGADNIAVEGLSIDGNKAAFASSQWKHGLSLSACTNVTLRDLNIFNCDGDALYVGASASDATIPCRNVYAENLRLTGSNRNNISVVGCDGGVFVHIVSTGAGGTNPQAGLDIEPNQVTTPLRDLTFIGCQFDQNVTGVFVSPYRTTDADPQQDYRFIACTANNNTLDGFGVLAGVNVLWRDGKTNGNGRYGVYVPGPVNGRLARNLRFSGVSEQNGSHGVFCYGTLQAVMFSDFVTRGNATAGTADGLNLTGTIDGLALRQVTTTGATQRYGALIGTNVTNFSWDGGDVRGNTTNVFFQNTAIRHGNMRNVAGYVTRASGVASVANGGTVGHGLVTTPTFYSATATQANRRVAITAVSSTTLTISLTDGAGAAITTAENVAWQAEV